MTEAEAATEIERLTLALAASEAARDRYEDCLRIVCHHLELPQSESGACDDSSAYDRALSALDTLYDTTETERIEHSKARYRAEAENVSLREQLAQADAVAKAAKEFMSSGVGKNGEGVPPWCTRSHAKLKEAVDALAALREAQEK